MKEKVEGRMLSKQLGRSFLEHLPLRRGKDGYPEIYVDAEWMLLCRTDLEDDVCTSDQADRDRTLEELRARYMKKILLGVRIGEGVNRRKNFACIDACTDG